MGAFAGTNNGLIQTSEATGTIKNNICVKITDVYDEAHELLRKYK